MKSISIKLAFSILTFSFILLTASCDKEDTTQPVITVGEPLEGAILSLTDDSEVHMEFTVTDETSLHELKVEVTNAAGDVVFSASPTVHDLKVYDFHEHFEPTGISAEVGMVMTITAEDHGDNVTVKTVNFKVKP